MLKFKKKYRHLLFFVRWLCQEVDELETPVADLAGAKRLADGDPINGIHDGAVGPIKATDHGEQPHSKNTL